jgi:hypothetical protein
MRSPTVALLPALFVAADVSVVHGYCLEGPLKQQVGGNWQIMRSIPVYIVGDPQQPAWGNLVTSDAEHNVRAAIDTWWEDSGADVRPYFAGWTTSTDPIGKVLVRWTTQCGECSTSIACADTDFAPTGERRGVELWFEANGCETWSAYPWGWSPTPRTQVANTSVSFRKVMTHELGHALGLSHPYDDSTCPAGGAMDINKTMPLMGTSHDLFLHKDDQDGVRLLYGNKYRRLEYKSASSSMLGWSNQPSILTQVDSTRPQGAGFAESTGVHIGIHNQFAASRGKVSVPGTTLTYSTPPATWPDTFSYYPVALTRGANSNDWLLAWVAPDATDVVGDSEGTCYIAVTRNNGSTWAVLPASLAGCAANQGPTAITAGSYYLVYWRGRLVWQDTFWQGTSSQWITYDFNGNIIDNSESPYNSVHTPVAACGTIGTYPCIVAFDSNEAKGCLNWQHFRVDAAGHVELFSSTFNSYCWAQYATPSLVWRQNDTLKPWGIAFRQGNTLFSGRAADFASSWTDSRQITSDATNGVHSPALRSYKVFQSPNWVYSYYAFTIRTQN